MPSRRTPKFHAPGYPNGEYPGDPDPATDSPEVQAAIRGSGLIHGPASVKANSARNEKMQSTPQNDANRGGKKPSNETTTPTLQLVTRRASDITPLPIEWHWPGYLPVGMLSEINGDPGEGKSTIAADIASRITTGRPFPHQVDPSRPPGNVLLLSGEDSAEHVIRQRLQLAGADLDRVRIHHYVAGNGIRIPLVLPDHLDLIRDMIRSEEVTLVILDPLNSFIARWIDSNSDKDSRSSLLYPLRDLAESTATAFLSLRHLNKGEGKAVYRGGGSIAYTASARVSLAVGRDQQGTRFLAPVKSNIGPEPPAIAFSIEHHPKIGSRVLWGDKASLRAEDLLATLPRAPGQRGSEAEALIRSMLANGPKLQSEIEAAADKQGVSRGTLTRAKQKLRVNSVKNGKGPWVWALPEDPREE